MNKPLLSSLVILLLLVGPVSAYRLFLDNTQGLNRFGLYNLTYVNTSKLYVDSTSGTTGNLMTLRNGSQDKFTVGPNGNTFIEGNITFDNTPVSWIKGVRGLTSYSTNSLFVDFLGGSGTYFRDLVTSTTYFKMNSTQFTAYRNVTAPKYKVSGSPGCIRGNSTHLIIDGDGSGC